MFTAPVEKFSIAGTLPAVASSSALFDAFFLTAAFLPDGRFAYVSQYSMFGPGYTEGQDVCAPGDGTGILIVDDLVDSGKTLELVRKLYPKAHFATVYAKPHGKPQVDTYVTEVSQDTWIFFPWDMALQYVQPFRGND